MSDNPDDGNKHNKLPKPSSTNDGNLFGEDSMFMDYLSNQLADEIADTPADNKAPGLSYTVENRVDKTRFPNSLYSHDLVVQSLNLVLEIRPMTPDDEKRAQQFCQLQMSEELKRSQPNLISNTPPKWSFTHVNYRQNFCLVAVDRKTDAIIAVAQYTKTHDHTIGEVGLAVLSMYQRHGVGSHLLQTLVQVAQHENDMLLQARFLPQNVVALHVFEKVMKNMGAPGMLKETDSDMLTYSYELSSTLAEDWEL